MIYKGGIILLTYEKIKQQIRFGEPVSPELFDAVADELAQILAQDRFANKPTQLRRFYDEFCLWHEKVQNDIDAFEKILPFIKMINAKVAYAKGRKLVDDNFLKFMQDALRSIKTKNELDNFKTFFEATLGFFKLYRPSDN